MGIQGLLGVLDDLEHVLFELETLLLASIQVLPKHLQDVLLVLLARLQSHLHFVELRTQLLA